MTIDWRNIKTLKVVGILVLGLAVIWSHTSCGERTTTANPWTRPQEVLTLSGHADDITLATYNPNGSVILTLSQDSTARLWDSGSGEALAILSGHAGPVRAAVFIQDGKRIRTYADDCFIKVWDVATGTEISSTPLGKPDGPVTCAGFNHDGSLLAIGLSGRSEVYDSETGELWYQLAPFGHPGLRVNTMDIGFRPDGGRIVTAAYSHEVAVWDARNGTRLLNLHGHGQGATTAVYNPEMTLIASGSRDKTVIIWDARLGTILTELDLGWEVLAAAFGPDGSTLLVVERAPQDQSRRASLWDTSTWKRMTSLTGFGRVCNSSFSPCGRRFVTPSGNTARVYEAAGGCETTASAKEEAPSDLPDARAMTVDQLVAGALEGAEGNIRVQAAAALVELGAAAVEVMPELERGLGSEDSEIRLNATLALADIGAPAADAVPTLIDMIQNDADARVRTAAALALGCISDAIQEPIAVKQHIQALKDEDARVRYHAAHALDKMVAGGGEILPALIETALTDPTFGIRRMIAFNIGNAGEASLGAIPTLIEGTSSPDERKRWWSSYIIWCISSGMGEAVKDAIPAIKQAMQDPSDYRDENGGPPRKYAIHAIGGVGPIVLEVDPHIIPVLGDIMINDEDYYHRKAAALALQDILGIEGEKLRHAVRGYGEQRP
ncbi:MAG: HEAT repeat domain-containing protein [Fidelibacterota bacterium]|nr:MAG: HEAT repeat domain-containing protein [Candidatus Neomarinimicrobiota bacterium]